MKVQTTAGQLRAGLRLFRGIIQRRNTIPVLGMVRFADGRMTGTDLDNELSVTLPTIGGMEGAAAIDWFGLAALADRIDPDEEVTITEADLSAAVAFNGSDYRMASCATADFPDFDMVDGEAAATGNLGLVASMRRVRFAASSNETRYYLNGVALIADPEGPGLVVATDGHRLAMMPLDAMPEGATGAIIHNDTANWLCAGKREPDSCIFAGVAPGAAERPRAKFTFSGMTLSAKLIDGNFPDIFRVIPRDPQPAFTTDREMMLRVLMRMRSFGGGRGRAVKLTGKDADLTLSLVYAAEGRSATENMPIEGGASYPFEMGFNVDYLVSALGELRGDHVTFAPEGGDASSSPCLITCDGDPLRIVQMPMRV